MDEIIDIVRLIGFISLAVGIIACIIKCVKACTVKCVEGCNQIAARRRRKLRRRRMLQRQEMEITQVIALESVNASEPITNEECDMNQPIPLADKPPSYSIVIRSENTSSEFKRVH